MIGILRLESWQIRRHDEMFNKKSFSCECINYISTFINGNIPPGSKIMSCWLYSYMVYFYTSGDYPMFLLPFERIDVSESNSPESSDDILSRDSIGSDIDKGKVIFSVGLEKEKRFYLRGKKNVLYEDDFLRFLKQNKIEYILYVYHEARSPRELEDYLNEKPMFERIFYRDYASIYRVKDVSYDRK